MLCTSSTHGWLVVFVSLSAFLTQACIRRWSWKSHNAVLYSIQSVLSEVLLLPLTCLSSCFTKLSSWSPCLKTHSWIYKMSPVLGCLYPFSSTLHFSCLALVSMVNFNYLWETGFEILFQLWTKMAIFKIHRNHINLPPMAAVPSHFPTWYILPSVSKS